MPCSFMPYHGYYEVRYDKCGNKVYVVFDHTN